MLSIRQAVRRTWDVTPEIELAVQDLVKFDLVKARQIANVSCVLGALLRSPEVHFAGVVAGLTTSAGTATS